MNSFIAMLRGINVSGQKSIKMADLLVYLEELSFTNVETYIQSGNIVFDFDQASPGVLEKLIHTKILHQYGFEVPVIVKTSEEMENVVRNNPFVNEVMEDPKRLYVTFLSEAPSVERVDQLKTLDCSPEQWILKGSDIYFFAPNGYGKAKMNNNFFENKLKVNATTRNWKTVNILSTMCQPG